MAVLIDGISKEYLEEVIKHARYGANNATIGSGWDITEVVRCEDCKFYWKNNSKYKSNMEDIDDLMMCLASPRDDAFCSEGERKDDE